MAPQAQDSAAGPPPRPDAARDEAGATAPPTLERKLDRARRALLDLTARNRLLNTPRHSARSKTLEIVGERSDQVFEMLVTAQRSMSFVPAPEPAAGARGDDGGDEAWLAQPEDDDEVDEHGAVQRHADARLQTALPDQALQKKLLALFYDARTAEEEQGVNILFLALGFLQWLEADDADVARHAPLLLIPCELVRSKAGGRIHLRARDDDIATNLSLQARLHADHGIELPPVPDGEDLVPSAYCAAVRAAVAGRKHWQVLDDDIVLGFFSFSKFLMYRDLDAGIWQQEGAGMPAVLEGLLGAGFPAAAPLWPEGARIDDHVGPEDMVHVLDADSSQVEAIEEVKAGRSLVIQGPPGTGKSQTIANLIAAAVVQGRRVLFVAEKMAALQVVHARLHKLGLGAMCFELHSRMASKKQVLADLEVTLGLGRPRLQDLEETVARLRAAAAALHRHADALHEPMEPAGITPYRALGEIVRHLHRGTPLPQFEIPDALAWTRAEFADRRQAVQSLCSRLQDHGPPAAHPWRGAAVASVLPTDLQRLQGKIDALRRCLAAAVEGAGLLAARLGLQAPATLEGVEQLVRFGGLLLDAPDADRACFAAAAWTAPRRELQRLVELGKEHAARAAAVDTVFRPEAWEQDPRAIRASMQQHGRSLFRWLRGDWRRAQAAFARLAAAPPRRLDERIGALQELEQARDLRAQLAASDAAGAAAFGRLWHGLRSDWPRLGAILDWVQQIEATLPDADVPALLARLDDPGSIARDCERLGGSAAALSAALADVVAAVQLDLPVAFAVDALPAVPLRELASRADAWHAEPHRLADWIPVAHGLARLRQLGLGELAARLHAGDTPPATVAAQFEYACHEAWMRDAMRRHPHLSLFDGRTHEEVVAEFRRLDQQRIMLAQAEVALAHWQKIPRGQEGVGELATVMREIKKKRRHLPIRRLLEEAGAAIQRIKPVFMMSPLSVAQFLAPRRLEFDLLLIDEASQVQPVDAFGALLRSRQVVVVGDEKQLPPTGFFLRMGGGDDDEAGDPASDLESILGLCSAQGLRQKMLRWHYRSQHQSLIAVSNRQFYGDGLHVVPSPFAHSDELGLKFHFVEGGVFDRGGRADNRVEAERVANAAIAHARTHPHESLGIGTFSVQQKEAILAELERLWRSEPDVREFFAATNPDPFFVKNLETIQGDERDVIFVSVGYGRDAQGFFAMHFGPLNAEGGERRLNVLITRARKRCEVFSSIHGSDIDLDRAQSRGPAALKEFLAYAATGTFAAGVPTGRGHDSAFEAEVARELSQLGYEIAPQVGNAGFYVDLAVVDPAQPGRYLLGIECDGAAYHACRSARDRDRLRQQVLESRGWTIHRIWSTDWLENRDEQKRRAVQAIERAQQRSATSRAAPGTEQQRPAAPPPPAVEGAAAAGLEREAPVAPADRPAGPATLLPYTVAAFTVPLRAPIHEVPLPQLVPIVERIVEVEGPVHRDEIARRVTSLWGLRRAGGRIQAQVDAALRSAVAAGSLVEPHRDFFDRPGDRPAQVRDRSAAPAGLRSVDMLPPPEIRCAIRHFVRENIGVDRDELARLVARAFGFKATSADMVRVVQRELEPLVQEGLVERDGKVFERTA